MFYLCAPSIIYLIFSITQILIDIFKGLYNTAFIKVMVTIMVTLLLNILCIRGLSFVSWIIVFIPFILMSVIVSIILYIFGLDAATGSINYKCDNSTSQCGDVITRDTLGNIIIYDPDYNSSINQVFYKSPNIIVPNPNNKNNSLMKTNTYPIAPYGSSSPAYKS